MNEAEGNLVLLAIESSCDDTAAAVTEGNRVKAHLVSGQRVHNEHGGIVPELASRAHQRNILPVVDAVLRNAGNSLEDLDGIAYTQGPGLPGSLHVGVAFARSLALSQGLPVFPVHHLQAHVLSHFIDTETPPDFPFLCCTVSGGHTQLVLMRGWDDIELIGSTLDDAAGEAFDKTARLLGFPYPGGPVLDQYAQEGDPEAFSFPEARVEGYDFSFSGLKTAVLYKVRKMTANGEELSPRALKDLAASVQDAVRSHIAAKIKKAIKGKTPASLGLAGGVAANSALRKELREIGAEAGLPVHIPPFEYCTDNAAMIGVAASLLSKGEKSSPEKKLVPLPRAPFPSKRSPVEV